MYHEDDFPIKMGSFSTWDEALSECKRMVDDQLHRWYQPGMSADKLYTLYAIGGEDPAISALNGNKTDKSFSGWHYARERSMAIAGDSKKGE